MLALKPGAPVLGLRRAGQLSADPLAGGSRPILESLANIGELLSGIGVVITLVYLAIQIRQNTDQLRRNEESAKVASLDETVRSFNQWREQVASDRATAEVWVRGLAADESLDAIDRTRFDLLLATYLYTMQAAHNRAKNVGAADRWARARKVLASTLSSPGGARYWVESRWRFDEEFAQDVDSLLGQGPPAG